MLDPKYVLMMLLLEFWGFLVLVLVFFEIFNVGHEKNRNIFPPMFLSSTIRSLKLLLTYIQLEKSFGSFVFHTSNKC